MAEIYRAKTFGAAGFEKEFAIKLILPSLVDDSEFVEMFINEAKLAVNLYHANIVQVFDLGELNDQYYIAMEFVHGKDLLDILARCAEQNIKIPLDLVLFIAMEMLKGLDFAHRATDQYGEPLNIIHRDVSPSNIMISYAGDVKVGDFGVAKATVERTLTQSGTLKGKVGYMSPEQVMGDEIDARSDLFAATIVLFEALSMTRLFVGDSDLDVMLKVRDAEIADSIKKAQPLPAGLVDILERGLTRHREDRFQTAGEFYQALVDFCFQHDIKVTGTDLSNFMRRLFVEEIKAEKQQRLSDPGSEAISRELLSGDHSEEMVSMSSASPPGGAPPPVAESAPTPAAESETPAAMALKDTAQVQHPEQETGSPVQQSSDAEQEESTETDDRYRYRDDSGLVFGPMGKNTLVDLLRVRRPSPEDEICVGDGAWRPLAKIEEIDLDDIGKSGGQLERDVNVDVSSAITLDDGEEVSGVDESETTEKPARQAKPQDTDDAPEIAGAGVLRSSSAAEDPEESETSTQRTSRPPAGELNDEDSPVHHSAPEMDEPGLASDTIRELKDQYATYEGELGEVFFGRILARLHVTEETGRLSLERDDIEKEVYFRDGEPILVESNRREELLGRFLRAREVITEEQLQEALNRLDEWGGRLGDALVAIDAIPAHALFEHLSAQMREKLLDVFTWPDGHYAYYENQEPETQAYSMGLSTYDTIVEGCRERVDIDRIRQFYDERTGVELRPRKSPAVEVDQLSLRTQEVRVFNELGPGDTIDALLDQFSVEQHETVFRTVFLLHQVETIAFEVTGKVDLPDLNGE